MKKIITTFVFALILSFSYAQPNTGAILLEGINYHNAGDYDRALAIYKKALSIDQKSPRIHYEMSLTYFSKKQYKNVILHTDKVLELNTEHVLAAYLTKGSALDELGRTKEAIELYKTAIQTHQEHFLLYMNLASSYYKIKDFSSAEAYAAKTVEMQPLYSDSHFLLANIHHKKGHSVQALLASHFFLLLEPNSTRSAGIYKILMHHVQGNVAVNNSSTQNALFVKNTKAFFTSIGKLNKNKNREIWWTFYSPFFHKLVQSGHIEAYCMYISQQGNPSAKQWLGDNKGKFDAFLAWFNE